MGQMTGLIMVPVVVSVVVSVVVPVVGHKAGTRTGQVEMGVVGYRRGMNRPRAGFPVFGAMQF